MTNTFFIDSFFFFIKSDLLKQSMINISRKGSKMYLSRCIINRFLSLLIASIFIFVFLFITQRYIRIKNSLVY